jgi:hypothetical protein
MHTTTSLHADHQLDQLASQCEPWRQTRAHPGERLPHPLWAPAAVLAQVLPYSRVAQHGRVSPSDLQKPMATLPASRPSTPAVPPPLSRFRPHPPGRQPQQVWKSTWRALLGCVSACGAPRRPRLWRRWCGPFWREWDAPTPPTQP